LHQFDVHTAFGSDVEERFSVANVAALFEIKLEQPADNRVLRACDAGPADPAMRVKRIGRALDRIERESDADRRSKRAQALMRGF
jgi:hypothetical protein